jgi:FkbM family methyltransferase
MKKLIFSAMRKLLLPLIRPKDKLPFIHWLHTQGESCENELLLVNRLCDVNEVAIDVGANVGLFSYAMSKKFKTVVAFEINAELTKHLENLGLPKIQIINKGLSSETGKATLYIPVLNGFPLLGWASLKPGNCPDTAIHTEKAVEITTLDSFQFECVSLIKIDVEGHELEVLKGARQTLAQHRPVVLVEVKAQNLERVTEFFAGLNYCRSKLDDLFSLKGSEENFIFSP